MNTEGIKSAEQKAEQRKLLIDLMKVDEEAGMYVNDAALAILDEIVLPLKARIAELEKLADGYFQDMQLLKQSKSVSIKRIAELEDPLKIRNDQIELLTRFATFLEDQGYIDTDWQAEPPFAIDTFLSTK